MDRFYLTYRITGDCVSIMLKAFETGTRFCISSKEWNNISEIHGQFVCKCTYDEKNGYYIVQVTNDERRRLIPILKKIKQKQ